MIRKGLNFHSLKNVLHNSKCLSSLAQPETKCPHESMNTTPVGWEDAKPYSKIPTPKTYPGFGIGLSFMPGGKYHGKSIAEFHQSLHEEFGDISRIPGIFGRQDILGIYDPDDIEMVYRMEGSMPRRLPLETIEYYRRNKRPDLFKETGGLLTENGDDWQKFRSKVNPIMMQPRVLGSYIGPVDGVACDFVEKIRKMRDSNNEVPKDFSNEMNKWAMESIACIAFNTRLGILDDKTTNGDAQKFIESVHKFFDLFFELDFMPSMWKFYKTPKFHQMMEVLDTMTDLTMKYIDQAIERIEEEKKSNPDPNRHQSVLEKLYQVDRHVAIVMAIDILLSGIDTTSGAALSFLYMMAKNPKSQDKLREEIMEKLPDVNTKFTPELMKNMPYLRACIKETLRIKNVFPGNLRITVRDLVIKGYQIPKGTNIAMASSYLQGSKLHFPTPTDFIPERWLNAQQHNHEIESAKKTHPFVYLPFGFGPRTCIGKRFAEFEIELLMSRVLRNFKVEWHHGDVKYGKQILNVPTGDLKFRFIEL